MEDTVQKAIEAITQYSTKFPQKEFDIIRANKEEATPYLRSAIDRAIAEKEEIGEDASLHFYALYLLAEFQDKESFPRIMELASLPDDTLDFLIGDAVTEGLCDILYYTYNGDLKLLKQTICNVHVDDFAKSAMLGVMKQLYLDQVLSKQEWQDFIRKIVYGDEEIGDYIYTSLAATICECHFVEMLPEVKRLYRDERVDPYAIGEFEDCIDMMFSYRTEANSCICPIDAAERLKHWAMFEQQESELDFDKLQEKVYSEMRKEDIRKMRNERAQKKIGRNDPCPCGSGKKYKQCCLNKPKSLLDTIESRQEREKWLEYYPPAKKDDEDGRIYLEDFFSQESIETDKMIYLALKHRAIPIWRPEREDVADKRKRGYLTAAWNRFLDTVEKEGISSFSEYDDKHSIHYTCADWTGVLQELLQEEDEEGLLGSVRDFCKKMKG